MSQQNIQKYGKTQSSKEDPRRPKKVVLEKQTRFSNKLDSKPVPRKKDGLSHPKKRLLSDICASPLPLVSQETSTQVAVPNLETKKILTQSHVEESKHAPSKKTSYCYVSIMKYKLHN